MTDPAPPTAAPAPQDLAALAPAALEEALANRLRELRAEVRRDPLSNPVRQLAHELSRELESGRLSKDKLGTLIGLLDKDAFAGRAEHVRRYLSLDDAPSLSDVVAELSDPLADYDAFEAFWTRRRETIVFTGHPTFLLRPEARERLVQAAAEGSVPIQGPGMPDQDVTLSEEHCQAGAAMRAAGQAIHDLTTALIAYAKDRFPGDWRGFRPSPIGLGTWVGYDMDGRNDIGWQSVIAHRLDEKRDRLGIYVERLRAMRLPAAEELTHRLAAAHARAEGEAAAFAEPLSDPERLAAAANRLTAEGEDRLTSLEEVIGDLSRLADDADAEGAAALLTLRAEMRTFGLGMGDVHFRLNAAQIRNAARAAIGQERGADLFGRSALAEVSDLIGRTKPVRVNFASLAGETSSAARLFIAAAQILKHVDAETPVRLLIAECENPVTVLTAIYLAKLFGVDHRLDVCPLFETAMSLDRGRRILDVLFQQDAYRQQAERRGRISIETGFSDAGRFMGQVPAGLAIERLQGQLADEMERHGLHHLEAVIYDTHGESMGRGGHPGNVVDRCLYACSPWARHQFSARGIALCHEQSFQGGDGYVWFTDEGTARATLAGILRAYGAAHEASPEEDPFYLDTAASLDFFNAVKRRQEDLFADPAYNVALGAMGLSLLPKTGSRKSRRQFDRGADEETSLRRIRAIPHNGILQQMGFLANILGGVGSAVGIEPEAYARLAERSDRMARIMRLVSVAASQSEMKTLIAYMKLYDGSFWATRPISGEEEHLEAPCAVLAGALSEDARYFAALQLAGRLRSDAIALNRALLAMDLQAGSPPIELDLLHAVRLALIQHAFLIAARLPAFTPQGGFSREDVMALIFALDVPQAVETLRETFPTDDVSREAARLDEQANYPARDGPRYGDVEATFIAPLEETYALILRVSVGVANHFAALG